MFDFFLISACYLYGINTEPIYCIDGETENKLVKAAMAPVTPENVKSISPSVSGNTISLNTSAVKVNVPSDLLNNVGFYGGLSAVILGGMKLGPTAFKSAPL
jgi:hypothetical protein